MVNVFPMSENDRGFDTRSGQTKVYKFDMCCSSAVAFREGLNTLLYRNEDVRKKIL
jgi:hypothetical protein